MKEKQFIVTGDIIIIMTDDQEYAFDAGLIKGRKDEEFEVGAWIRMVFLRDGKVDGDWKTDNVQWISWDDTTSVHYEIGGKSRNDIKKLARAQGGLWLQRWKNI